LSSNPSRHKPRRPLGRRYSARSRREHFIWRKSAFGRPNGYADVDDEQFSFFHPLLKQPVTVPMQQARACVRVEEISSDDPLLVQELRRVDFGGLMVDATIVVLLDPPAHIDRFKYGAERGLATSRKERKRGLDLDVVGLLLEDPDGVAAALEGAGPTRYATVNEMLRREVGEPTSLEAPSDGRSVERRPRRPLAA
jgi:hypothetical protein